MGVTRFTFFKQKFQTFLSKLLSTILKLINDSSRENKENHHCDCGLDMCS